MINGTLLLTNNIQEGYKLQYQDFKLVMLCEDNNKAQQNNAISLSILLPCYEAVCASEVNGDMIAFQNIYLQQLNSYEANRAISGIVRALTLGINICLYVEPDMMDMAFIPALIQYFSSFGIIVGIAGIQNPGFVCTNEAICNICTILYLNDHINAEELMVNFPAEVPFPENIIIKLKEELNPYVPVQDYQHYADYFNNLKFITKQNGNNFVRDGIQFGGM